MAIDFVKSETAPLFVKATGNKKILELLWGDRVRVVAQAGSRAKVKARGTTGFVPKSDLGGQSLLEVYFIDVGQGDGVLIRTPEHRHVLIDGGYNRKKQPTGKNAADFVDWKFAKDYRKSKIELDVMIASHCDADHYGGLWDLLNPDEKDELDAQEVRVEDFYHAGLGWWKKPSGGRELGPHINIGDESFFTRLLENRSSVIQGLNNGPPHIQGEWAKFLERVTQTKRKNGGFCRIQRLSHVDQFVPGFAPDSSQVSLRILAPVEFDVNGKTAIRRYGSKNGLNTNGNSLLFRLDYGNSRILLTGDLNTKSQRALLEDWAGERQEFSCDVAKGCHHGAEDVSYEFLQAMRPAVTVIPSGDNEGHDHPRPSIVAASATTGYIEIDKDKLISPLVYSTEIARSVSLGNPTKVSVPDGQGGKVTAQGSALKQVVVNLEETKAGDLNPRKKTRSLGSTRIVAGIVYGLVNVRTDGKKILCAVMNEKDHSWQIKTIESRF